MKPYIAAIAAFCFSAFCQLSFSEETAFGGSFASRRELLLQRLFKEATSFEEDNRADAAVDFLFQLIDLPHDRWLLEEFAHASCGTRLEDENGGVFSMDRHQSHILFCSFASLCTVKEPAIRSLSAIRFLHLLLSKPLLSRSTSVLVFYRSLLKATGDRDSKQFPTPLSLSGDTFRELGRASSALSTSCQTRRLSEASSISHSLERSPFLAAAAPILYLVAQVLSNEKGDLSATAFASQALLFGGDAVASLKLATAAAEGGAVGSTCLRVRAAFQSCQSDAVSKELLSAAADLLRSGAKRPKEEVERLRREEGYASLFSPSAFVSPSTGSLDCVSPFDALLLPFGGALLPLIFAERHALLLESRVEPLRKALSFRHAPQTEKAKKSFRIAVVTSDFGDSSVGRELLSLFESVARQQVGELTKGVEGVSRSFGKVEFVCALIDTGEKRGATSSREIIQKTEQHCSGGIRRFVHEKEAIELARFLNEEGSHACLDVDVWMPSRFRVKFGEVSAAALALRPCPLQVSFKNFVGTSGAPWMTHIVTDRVASPPEYSDFYSERLLFVPPSFYSTEAYRERTWESQDEYKSYSHLQESEIEQEEEVQAIMAQLRAVDESLSPWASCLQDEKHSLSECREKIGMVAAFHNHRKLDERSLRVVKEVLSVRNDTLLWTFQNPPSCLPTFTNRLICSERAEEEKTWKRKRIKGEDRRGSRTENNDCIDASRVVISQMFPRSSHVAVKRAAWMGLDPLFYNGHSATADLLFSGVPVLTLPGERMASRVSASLLLCAGLGDFFISRSLEDYVRKGKDALRCKTGGDATSCEYESNRLRLRENGGVLEEARRRLDLLSQSRTGPFDGERWANAFINILRNAYETVVVVDGRRRWHTVLADSKG